MKFTWFLLIYFGSALGAAAQKTYFIYLQTDTQVPFYVKMNDRISSSSSAGYLILSNLADSTYRLSFGLPSSRKESRFEIKVSGKDRGFLIKAIDGGYRLQDLQTGAVIRSQNTTENNVSYQARNDAFTELLSRAANDPGLLFVQVAVKEEKPLVREVPATEQPKLVQAGTKTETELPNNDRSKSDSSLAKTELPDRAAAKKDSLVISEQTLVQTETKSVAMPVDSLMVSDRKETITNAVVEEKPVSSTDILRTEETDPVYKRSAVKKYSESSTSEGFGLTFLDKGENGTDTIRLVIPNQKFDLKQPGQKEVESEDVLLEIIRETNASKKTVKSDTAALGNCKITATENDFFKLRRSMAGKTTDPAMVEEARKYFKTKCFSTEQIRNLSALFLTASGKYDFFTAAYPHVTDKNQFGSLQSEFRDEAYIKRFKTLVGE